MLSEKIAAQIISSMGSQIDLLFTLSVAICGGIVVLILQVTLHNSSKTSNSVKITWPWALIVTFLLEGASIVFGYLCRGAITDNIPSIYRLDFSQVETWGNASFEGASTLLGLFSFQFFAFGFGVIVLFIFVIANINKIGGSI